MKLNALRSNIISSRDSKLFSASLGWGGPVLIQSSSRKERIVMWKRKIFSLFFSSSSFFSFGTITCLVVSTADSREMNKQQMNINGDFGNSWSRLVWQLCGHVGSTPTYRHSLLINWSCFTWCILHALHILLFHELESHGFVVINYSTSLRKFKVRIFLPCTHCYLGVKLYSFLSGWVKLSTLKIVGHGSLCLKFPERTWLLCVVLLVDHCQLEISFTHVNQGWAGKPTW